MKPQQRLAYSKKTDTWRRSSYDWYSQACTQLVDSARANLLYKAANGELDESDYTYVTNPLNETDPRYTGYPAKMKNYDILSPNINTLIGDFIDRLVPPIVYAINSDFDVEQFELYRKEIVKLLQKEFINRVTALGGPFQEEEVNTKLADIERKVKNLPNEMAMQGQTALNYIVENVEAARKFREQFYDYTVICKCFSYKDTIDDEVIYKALIPDRVYGLLSEDVTFLENAEAAKVIYKMSKSEIYDRFQTMKGFDKEFIEWLDTTEDAESLADKTNTQFANSDIDNAGARRLMESLGMHMGIGSSNIGVEVEHLQWRSQRKIFKVKTINIFGQVEQYTYSDKYIPGPNDISVDELWVDDLWEGYQVDGRFYLGIERVDTVDPEDVKLCFNGRTAFNRYTPPQSLVEKGLVFQKKHNIVSYNMEATLNKSLDKLIVFPLSLIPDKEGWNEKTTMYYAKALSFLFVNDAASGFGNAINGLKAVDASLNQYIIQAYEILERNKMQWDEVCGISPQRKANISSSAGKGVSQLAIQRSYVINEKHFTEFDEYLEREYQGFLDKSQFAFKDGKKSVFINRSGTLETLNIVNPQKFSTTKFGVFAKNGRRERQKLEELRGQAQAFAQNLTDPALVAKIIDSDNYSEIMSYMDQMSEKLLQRAEAASEQQSQLEQAKLQGDLQAAQAELEFKYYKTDSDNLRAERVAIINSIKQSLDAIEPAVNNPDSLKEGTEMLQMFNQRKKDISDNFFKLKEVEMKEKELQQREEEMKSKERIAKADQKVALKNKVSGEK